MSAAGRILIVDDDPSLVEALRAALGPYYEILTSNTGLDALELIARQPLDLVLLDYLLPDVSGLTILRTIKKLFPSVLVILITAFGSEDVSVESFRGGARDYLKKPINVSELLARMERLLTARKRTLEARSPVLWEAEPGPPGPVPGSRAASIQRAVAFIRGHLGTPLTLDQVSREAGMSKFHFCRHFKDFTGLTFREYLARRRITRATELLCDKERSVTEVYLELGFKDMTHFGRVFRKITGQLPSLYRRAAIEPPPR